MNNNQSGWILTALLAAAPLANAADHLEATGVDSDVGLDLLDCYAFLEPADNTRIVLACDVHGFIVPGENANVSAFKEDALFRFNIENTGDAKPDMLLDVSFEAQTSRSVGQVAHIALKTNKGKVVYGFDGVTTVGSATDVTARAPAVTLDPFSGIRFFAGLTDDPFFFDIPAFNRFVGSVGAGAPNLATLQRGRDTFAGYNVQMIAMSVPVSLLVTSTTNTLGIAGQTFNAPGMHSGKKLVLRGRVITIPNRNVRFSIVDRMGNPAINTVAIPYARKNEYNLASPEADAAGKFAPDIIATFKSLGTSDANINALAGIAVTKGDYLHVDVRAPNTGPGGGNNAGGGFPNGRRPGDDVIDTVLFVATNGGLTTGDSVNANDKTFLDVFPYFAPAHQPRDAGVADDGTRN